MSDQLKNYTGGILNDTTGNKKLDHFVTIYGWGEDSKGVPFWNVMNSWGVGWG